MSLVNIGIVNKWEESDILEKVRGRIGKIQV